MALEVQSRVRPRQRALLVTVLSSLAVGYFQYLSAYQEKVGSQAREHGLGDGNVHGNLTRILRNAGVAATLYSDFTRAVRADPRQRRSAGHQAAPAISERYEKARIALRENIDVLTRKAEVYIDWASDMYRDAADKRNVDDDPLSQRVLRDYASIVPTSTIFRPSEMFMRRTAMRPSRKFQTTNIAPLLKNGAWRR